MVFTFASTGNSAYHNGQNLEIKLALQNADTISADTSNLSITLTNLTKLSENPIVTTLYNWQLNDILSDKYPNSSINNEGTVVTLNLPLDSSMKSVQVVAKENDKHGTERTLLNAMVNIKSRPSTPTISVKSALTFGLNGAGPGVMVTGGTLSVTPASGEGTTQILLFQRGTNSAGTNFMQQVASYPVPQTGPTTVIIQLTTANLVDMQADSVNYLNVQSENDQGESNYSNSISFVASVRQATPTLLSAKSFEDAKVTLTGTMNPVPASYYSVLGSTEYNSSDPLQNWYPTNVTNVAITAASQSAFTQSVNQFKGAVLASGAVYNFTIIQHATALLLNNNEVAVDTTLLQVPLTQSSISNVLSAVPLAYVPSNVALNASSQSFADNKLIFAPTITNAASIPSNMNAFFDFKVNGSSKGGVIANATGSYSVPHPKYHTVTDPIKGDHYELSLRLDYLLTAPQIAAITGTPALSIYTDPSTHFNYASVFSQSKTVVQNPSANDVPQILDIALSTVTVGTHKCLAMTYVAPSNTAMTTLGVDVDKYEIQLIKGIPGNPPQFPDDQLVALNADGTKTFNVIASSSSNIPGGPMDAAEYAVLKTYQNGAVVPLQHGHHSAQIRAVFASSSGIINGKWQNVTLEVLEDALSAPASVSVSPALAPTANGSSVSVAYKAVQTTAVLGIPSSWLGVKAVAAVGSLFDKDGKNLAGPLTKTFTAAEHAAYPGGDVASSMTFNGLSAGTLLYASMKIVYQRVSSTGELMSDVKDGSQLLSALYAIKSNATIASIKLVQTPVSSHPRGLDQNGGTSYKVTVTADAGNNDPSSLNVKTLTPANVNGVTQHVHDLPYDSVKKEWSAIFNPVAGYDYANNLLHVIMISGQNVDVKSQ